MKQFDPASSKSLLIEKFSSSPAKIATRRNCKRRGSYLMAILVFALLSFGGKANANAVVTNSVTYNAKEGTLDVRLLIYAENYNGGLDGFIDQATLSFTAGGVNKAYFLIDLDTDNNNGPIDNSQSLNGYHVNVGDIQAPAPNTSYWYRTYRLYLNKDLQNITGVQIIGSWAIKFPLIGNYALENFVETTPVTIIPVTPINITQEFMTVNNEAVSRFSYTKSQVTAADKNTKISLWYQSNQRFSSFDSVKQEGHYDIPLFFDNLAAEEKWFFKQVLGDIEVTSPELAVPAFQMPFSVSGEYDSTIHQVTISWSVNAIVKRSLTDKYIKVPFIYQFADNPDFKNATTARLDYDPDKTEYRVVKDKNISSTLYFRVSRDYTGANWDTWAASKMDSLKVPFNQINAATVTLQPDFSALVEWTVRPNGFIPGSSFVITRTNNTTKTKTEITLTKDDYYAGSYKDELIAICNEYEYKIQVIPPAGLVSTPFQIPGKILPTQIGVISNLVGSKGYFPDRTELKWTSQGNFDNFIVKRSVYGTNNYVQVLNLAGGSSGDFQAEDSRGTPGTYYTYMVVGVAKCNNQSVYSKDTLYSVGFRSPTGNIDGRITYENGQAVENAVVRLKANDAAQLGQSIFFNGSAKSFLKIDSLHVPLNDTSLTVETWIRPTDSLPKNQTIFSREGQYKLGFDGTGSLAFTYNGKSVTGKYVNPTRAFIHIAGVHSRDSLMLVVNDSVIASTANAFAATSQVQKGVFIGRDTTGNQFKGYLDEMRVWNIALSKEIIKRDYTRLLPGEEEGLVAYWRFDETIKNQFYDLSHKNDQYNQNDGFIIDSAIHSGVIPSADQLSLKGITDTLGDYSISGIPYVGNGTAYSIVPSLGTHKFDPVSASRLISASSNQFTVDFKDKSAFDVSGFVYFSKGTVPVEGVNFKIDGRYVQDATGNLVGTDANGKFVIKVPVGTHEVQAVKFNHVFDNDGQITDYKGNKLNYQAEVAGITLADNTKIRFDGRVAGGAIQEAFPLGHSLSTNNLGKDISITLTLPATGKAYDIDTTNSNILFKHFLPSNETDSSKIHSTNVRYFKDKIVITPDPVTGEFVTDLIPVKYNVSSVNVTHYGDLLNGKPLLLDLTNKFVEEKSTYEYIDSTPKTGGGWNYTNYSDTVKYNASSQFIKRHDPSVTINQLDVNENPLPYFGNKAYQSISNTGAKDTIPLIDLSRTGKNIYLFGNPVFTQGQQYAFGINAFEEYAYYKTDNEIAQVNGHNRIDRVPTQDGFVTMSNKLRAGGVASDTVSLDNNGFAKVEFQTGDPDFAAKGLKTFSATIRFGNATPMNWNFFGDAQMKAYLMGGKMTGTNFVTAGPDKLLMVLRDPPGSGSFSYAEKGSTITTSTTYSGKIHNEQSVGAELDLGTTVVTFVGLGAGLINEIETENTLGEQFKHEEEYTYTNTKEASTTLTTRFQTSDDPTLVGAPADVFVGYSTNLTYGQSNNLTIVKKADVKATDVSIDSIGNYMLIQRGGINMGETFGTMFAFPQVHIKNVLIPNLIKIRDNVLLPPTTSSADAQNLANTSKKAIYVSKYDASDTAHFGKSNNDQAAFGPDAVKQPFGDGKGYKIYFPATSLYRSDTILIINQWVENWQKRLADNEQAKLESKLLQNYSFHGGSPVEYSKEAVVAESKEHEWSMTLSGTATGSTSFEVNNTGFELKYESTLSAAVGGVVGTSTENTSNLGFSLASNTSDYYSVDVKTAEDNTFVFRTKGGASACPYEGEVLTEFYQPGTVLDQPTQRVEVPKIAVETPVVTNVPSSRSASFKLLLRNDSETGDDVSFILGYVDNDSIKGATISVDGTPIGGTGRSILVKAGETLTKVLTITKGPNDLEYNDIMILLRSACQYDPTGYLENIADTVLVSAHFIPSCSDIAIKFPQDQWVVNTSTPLNANGKRYLPITIDKFDINNALFDHIELQTKSSSQSTWTVARSFYADSAKYLAASGTEKSFISNPSAINYNLELDDANYSDQNYDIQAVSICKTSATSFVTTESNKVSGIKDTYFPRLFGSPQPANGVLGISDEVRLNFNETIAAGLLNYTDFQVTGIKNGVKGDHSVSVKLDGQTNFVATEFEKNLTAKNITAEMWILPAKQADQTIFSHGSINESMELALTSDNHLQVTVGAKVIRSDKAVDYKPGEWAHVALVYNAATKTVTAIYNFVEYISNAPVDIYAGIGHFEYGRSISKQGNFFTGKMHEARVWSDTLTAVQIQINSLTQFSGAENKMLAYYPMNEGKGTEVLDKAHGSNAELIGQWTTPAGKAVTLKGNSYVKMNTASTPVTSDMDYTLELWFKADASQANATIASNGKGDGTDGGGSLNLFSVGFENSKLTYWNNGVKVQADENYLDNKWHHFAFAVNRNSGNAQLFVDGILRKYVDAKNISGIAAPSAYLGVTAYHDQDSITVTKYEKYFSGNVDEFRIWKTYLNQTIISNNNNVHLKGDEIGLLSYYPFEKYFVFLNNAQLGYTLSDMKIQEVPNTVVPDAIVSNAVESDETAPIKSRGPVDNLKFDFVVNNDALIINLLEPKQAIDKTVVTFTVKNVRDLNGNPILSPITWTAYIDRNQLKWSDDELNLTKDVYAPMQFESYLVNSGGNEQKYRLDNLPTWLSANPATGTIAPKGRQKVTFTVNEGLNVGQYDEIVYMRNDNNESEALAINLSVKGKQPDWTVNPADFRYNMSVYGKIRINNNFSTNKDDLLAAFINGRCVGVTKNSYNKQNDLWYTYMTVYSDTVQFENLEFRIYQAATGKTYQGVPTPARTIAFSNNAIIGTAQTPIIFDGKEIVFQDITLNQNWNWISFNVVNGGTDSINSVLKNGKWQSDDLIKNEEKGFNSYTSLRGWLGQLDTVRNVTSLFNRSLFMLKTANAQTLSVTGTVANVKSIPILLRGNRWSYISYLPQVNMTVKDALAGYAASDEDVIKSQSGFAMYDSRNGWVGNLTYLEPGKGYMFYRKAATDVSFYYPSLNGSLTNQPSGRGVDGPGITLTGAMLNPLQSPTEGNFMFAQNMTVTAVLESDFVVKPGDKVSAYVNGDLRSKAISIHNAVINAPTFFFNIAGGQEQPVYFQVERNGEVIGKSSAMFNFKTDNTVGTVGHPLVIHLKKSIVGVSIYPNPFFSEVNINVKLSASIAQQPHEVQVSVYDINGKLIISRSKETVNTGTYRASWNGQGINGFECAKGTYLLTVSIDGIPHNYKVIKN